MSSPFRLAALAATVTALLAGEAAAVVAPRPSGTGLVVEAQLWREDRSPGTVGQGRQVIESMKAGSIRFRKDVARCARTDAVAPLLACTAVALDDYADWLDGVERTPRSVLPVAVPAVRRAAERVRVAGDVGAARAAIAEASATVAKTIALVRAGGDDEVRRLEIAQRSVVQQSLAAADAVLVRAVGI